MTDTDKVTKFVNDELVHWMKDNAPAELVAITAAETSVARANDAIADWMVKHHLKEICLIQQIAHEYLVDYDPEEFDTDQGDEYAAVYDCVEKALKRADAKVS